MSWFQILRELQAAPPAETPAKGPRVESSFILNPALGRPARPERPRLRLVKPAPRRSHALAEDDDETLPVILSQKAG